MALEITNENFEQEVLNSKIPVLIDFWAPWCGPCKTVAPIIEEVEAELEKKVKVCKVNIDDNSDLATRYSVMSIPTLIVVKDGNVMESKVGALGKDDLKELLQSYL